MCRLVALLGIAVGLAACAVRLPPVDGQMAKAATARGLALDDVHHGYRLMTTACVACHQATHPAWLEPEEWDDVLPRMLQKAKLGAGDGAAIRAYVLATRAWLREP